VNSEGINIEAEVNLGGKRRNEIYIYRYTYIYMQQVLALNQGMVSSYTYAQAGGFRNGTGSRVAEVPAPFDS
jgi:hypothetical protein